MTRPSSTPGVQTQRTAELTAKALAKLAEDRRLERTTLQDVRLTDRQVQDLIAFSANAYGSVRQGSCLSRAVAANARRSRSRRAAPRRPFRNPKGNSMKYPWPSLWHRVTESLVKRPRVPASPRPRVSVSLCLLLLCCLALLSGCSAKVTPTPAPTATIAAKPAAPSGTADPGQLAAPRDREELLKAVPALGEREARFAAALASDQTILTLENGLDDKQQKAQKLAVADAQFQAFARDPETNQPVRSEIMIVRPALPADLTDATAAACAKGDLLPGRDVQLQRQRHGRRAGGHRQRGHGRSDVQPGCSAGASRLSGGPGRPDRDQLA